MILLAALVLSLLIALITGGRLSRLAHLPLRHPWLALLAFGLQLSVIYAPPAKAPGLLSVQTGSLLVSYLMLLVFVWINRRLTGMLIVGLGLVLNLSVMLANGGYMPITPEAVIRVGHQHELRALEPGERLTNTKDVLLPREQTALWFLSDIFVLPPPFPIPSVFSPGDAVIAAGLLVLILAASHRSSLS